MAPHIRVLIAYDTLAYREGLKAILKADDIFIVDEAFVEQGVILLAQRPDVDVVVMGMSWHYDDEAGARVIAELKQRVPDKWIVAIGERQDLVTIAKQIGADVALTIRLSREELLDSIRSRNVSFDYDIFISYSPHDCDFVETWLLPTLEASNMCVCIDVRDFRIGAIRLLEIERAVLRSRRTLLVLTPEYLASEWKSFENILAQTLDPAARKRRLLPLLLKPCKLPHRLDVLNYLDFTANHQDGAKVDRLITAMKHT